MGRGGPHRPPPDRGERMIWDDEFETLPREALAALQPKRLRALVERVYSAVAFYRRSVDAYTRRDSDAWAELMARPLACGGTTKGDVVHNAYGYGLFTGGLRAHYGAERIGATVIPISGGNTKRQIMLMQDFGSTILLCTPSSALNLAEGVG